MSVTSDLFDRSWGKAAMSAAHAFLKPSWDASGLGKLRHLSCYSRVIGGQPSGWWGAYCQWKPLLLNLTSSDWDSSFSSSSSSSSLSKQPIRSDCSSTLLTALWQIRGEETSKGSVVLSPLHHPPLLILSETTEVSEWQQRQLKGRDVFCV